jgi:Domain of unknown function (DUF1877)
MGLDLWTYPVRWDSAPMRLIREDPQVWKCAIGNPPFNRHRGRPVPEICRQLLAEVPDAMELAWEYPDRSYHQAEYLLDPAGYRRLTSYEERELTMPYRIVQGDKEFAWHARGAQGIPWRYSTNDFLIEAVLTIDAVDPAAARREFSVADMLGHRIYRANPSDEDNETFEHVLANLREMARYYERIVDRGLDLIFVKD